MRAGFSSKQDLIDKLKGLATGDLWTDRLNSARSWTGLSNQKLLRLHAILSEVKEKYGSREKLIDALVAAMGRATDKDFRTHFALWPLPRLLDAVRSAEKRKAAEAPATETPAAKPAAKAEAAPAAKKPAAAKKGTAAKASAAPAAKKPAAAKKGTAKAPAAKKGAKKG
jgi:hypothetical protein